MDHGRGPDLQDVGQVGGDLPEKTVGFEVLEVADVLRDEGLLALRQAEGVLEQGARAEDDGPVLGQVHGRRGEAARPADELGRVAHGADHGVVAADEDVAVVQEEGVGDGPEPAQGLAVAQADGLGAHVARGHDQGRRPGRRCGQLLEEHVVQRRVGQHDAQKVRVRRQPRRESGAAAALGQDDGPLASRQETLLAVRELAHGAGGVQVADHDRQRLVPAVLALPQQGHGLPVAGVADQVESAQALHGRDAARHEQFRHAADGRVVLGHGPAFPVRQPQPGAARGAGVGLGVEAAVQRVLVFRQAVRAQGEAGHGRGGAVVGDGAGDGVARPAVGAVGEGVAVAAVRRVAQVRDAVVAGGHVGADEHLVACAAGALEDAEIPLVGHGVGGFAFPGHDAGQGRDVRVEAGLEGVEPLRAALDLDEHPFGGVQDQPGDAGFQGGLVDEGAEAYSLHPSGDDPFPAFCAHWVSDVCVMRSPGGRAWRLSPGRAGSLVHSLKAAPTATLTFPDRVRMKVSPEKSSKSFPRQGKPDYAQLRRPA
ncbi:hypothetical protein DSECCO2_384550 [anaerobic digester metagenome]